MSVFAFTKFASPTIKSKIRFQFYNGKALKIASSGSIEAEIIHHSKHLPCGDGEAQDSHPAQTNPYCDIPL